MAKDETMDWKHENGQHFEQHAQNLLLPVYPWLLQDLQQACNDGLTGKTVLEIGCGPGFMLPLLFAATQKQVFAVDLSEAMLKLAKTSGRAANASLTQGEASHLPFAMNSFDIVYSRGSIFFWPDINSALSLIAQVMKPGGMALIGGGYGLSTPQALIDSIAVHRGSEKKKEVPRLDLETLLTIARQSGGNAELLQARKRGFWLKWSPKN